MEFSKDDYILVTDKSLSGIKKIPVASSFKTYVESTTPTHNYIQVLYHSQSIILDEHTLNITVSMEKEKFKWILNLIKLNLKKKEN